MTPDSYQRRRRYVSMGRLTQEMRCQQHEDRISMRTRQVVLSPHQALFASSARCGKRKRHLFIPPLPTVNYCIDRPSDFDPLSLPFFGVLPAPRLPDLSRSCLTHGVGGWFTASPGILKVALYSWRLKISVQCTLLAVRNSFPHVHLRLRELLGLECHGFDCLGSF
jgi:hypothetical protein